MARPKGKLFILLAVFAAIGLVAASGAFTSVSAERTAEVNVAGDSDALLQIDGTSAGVTGVVSTSNGQVELNFNNGNGNANGINPGATTDFDSVLVITNQGADAVDLTVTLSDDDSTPGTPGDYINIEANHDGTEQDLEDGSVTLSAGESATIDVEFDLTGTNLNNEDILDNITFEANAN